MLATLGGRSFAVALLVGLAFLSAAHPATNGLPEPIDDRRAALSPVQVENVALLGRVWGFVKYHHPKVASGEARCDDELLSALPAVLAADTPALGRAAIHAWVASLGDPRSPARASTPTAEVMSAPIRWISDRALLGNELVDDLERIRQHRASSQFYVSQARGVGNPIFDGETETGPEMSSDARYRILAVLRYWNAIEYWFPYRNVMGEDWEAVLPEFISRAYTVSTVAEYRLMWRALVARIHDTHAVVRTANAPATFGTPTRLPVAFRFIEGQLVVTDIGSEGLALRRGDVVAAIDGEPVAHIVERWRPLVAASNEATVLREVAEIVPFGPAGPVHIDVVRDQAPVTLEVERTTGSTWEGGFHDHRGAPFRRLSASLAYLTLSSAREKDADEYVRAAQGAAALVIDLREYPAEFMVFALGRHLVAEYTPFARFTRGDLSNPGAFVWSDTAALTPKRPRVTAKVALLVDESTQSQAEYTAMAFRTAPGAIVVGSTTAGADGNVSTLPLPGGLETSFSGIGVFTPDGQPTQRVGIARDIDAHPTIAGVRAGRDEVLETAVRALLGREMTDAERRLLVTP